VAIELVFETHSTTVDNEQGHATGWNSWAGAADHERR
jgi:predicted component of type VI protein secretion system